jgi:hypothetical protein
MPVRDWTRVDVGIFHAFHHHWICALGDVLNGGVLPSDFYVLPERWPYALPLHPFAPVGAAMDEETTEVGPVALARPQLQPTAETDMEFYRRKQNVLVVRHVSGDRMVAVIEILSPGNKSTRRAFRDLVEKAASLLGGGIHLLLIDLFPPGPRDPHGPHAAIWDELAAQDYLSPADKPLTVASYDAGLAMRAYVRHFAVGDPLSDMPLFLRENGCGTVPLEATAEAAFAAQPARFRRVLDAR